MSHLLKEFRGKVDLVYIDPPFDSKADYKKIITMKGKSGASDLSSFEEKQYTDIWTNDEYLQFLYERVILLRELLSEQGSIYLHCDNKRNHFIKMILDEVFGNFRSQISWKKTSAHSDSKVYGDILDTILFYTKSNNYIFNNLTIGYDEWYKKRYFRYVDSDGRNFKSGDLSANGLKGGGYHYNWKGIDGYWRCPMSTMEKLDKENRIFYTKNNIPRLKQYLDESEGIALQNLWDDIQPVVSWSDEQTNYPTQKPEILLERIILSSTNPGSLVLDCFMGSGTTQAVAMKLARRFIGADINLGAIQTTTKRLNRIIDELKEQGQLSLPGTNKKLYLNFEVYNVNHYDVFRNPVQARELLLQALEVEPLESTDVFDGMKDGYKVKIMPVNRIATRADLNPILSGINYREMDKRMEASPGSPAERIMLVCMGHEPDLAASLKMDIGDQYRVDVQVVDILRDRKDLAFKYDSEADIAVENGELVIRQFYPRNLLQKLSMLDENVEDWRQLVETVAIDWNYNGEVLQPAVYDNPGKNELVQGRYKVPGDQGRIRVKITDLLSESLETTLEAD
ncbi:MULTISPECIES: site-specific DNA-methyltransferase [unclassified Desulfovibrio]|uniref:site-specific DNA-methyltransferase n=1 Tax=unclassified Desulfovibrio TaxID=2593640 RepID=UPI001F14AF27|nr:MULTISPECIES: site-specific DNA-methyltransferase [unclassified Desulfovibrio]